MSEQVKQISEKTFRIVACISLTIAVIFGVLSQYIF